MKPLLSQLFGRVFVLVRSLGPYAAIELILPGGSILAVLYWWHRRRTRQVAIDRRTVASGAACQAQASIWLTHDELGAFPQEA